jgi:hypothetical protein
VSATHDEIIDLLGAYALDAVDDDERVVVRDHLAGCARCRAEVQEHQEVATFLAHGGGDAPAGVWERIAGSLEESPPGLRLVPADPASPPAPARRLPRPGRLSLVAAAAAAAVVGVLGLQVTRQDDRIDELEVALDEPLEVAYAAALADPRSDIIELASPDGQVALRGAVAPDGTGYLRAAPLPGLDADRTYQLWGGAGDQLVSLGVLGHDPDIVSFTAHPYELFAITEEASPGVITSANPPVVSGAPT